MCIQLQAVGTVLTGAGFDSVTICEAQHANQMLNCVLCLHYALTFYNISFFSNPILFTVGTSTFSKLCENLYSAYRRVLSSTSL
jgi:hypothetical protein